MVVEQLRRELLARVEQLLTKGRALFLDRRERLRLDRLGQRERPERRERLRAPLEQPVAQEPRRDAVLVVVLVDLAQERVVARLHPLLEDDDRGAAVLHLGLPLEVEERLHLLQPVARPRGADAVADDAEQVDEDVAAEQVVELPLARAVAAHQPLERGDLVGGVVVDVQVGVAREPLVHEVDEALERDPLRLVVVRVERLEVAVDVEDPPEVLEPAARVPERVALEVEEEVAGRGVGQEREARLRLRLQEPVIVHAGLARVQLELGLLAVLRPAVRVDPGRHGLGGRAPELRERRDPGGGELLDLRPVDPGDAREVVDLVPARVADGLEVADRAVVDRVRLGRRRVGDEALEPRADAPVVGGELDRAEGLLLARAEQDVNVLRLAPLDERELLVVEEELEDVGGLRGARELGVERLVGAVRLLHQEVGDAAPAVAREDGLVDHVRLAGADRVGGGACGSVVVAVGVGELEDGEPLRAEALEVGALVLEPLAKDQLRLLVLDVGPLDLPTRVRERERRQVLAGQERRDVGG